MIDSGDTAWILTSTALVLFMTMPGLALFYAGLVQSRNILSVLMQCSGIACAASLLWFVCGYSLAFTEGSPLLGDLSKMFLFGVPRDAASGTIPESAFAMFQMTFAVITPALIVGAFVERIKFAAVMLFSSLWLLVVYVPVTHWVWGGGWLADMGVMDFAGGIVVHATAGISAIVIALALGIRKGFPESVQPPHAPWMVMVGAAMLWVGWFGFNGGSALAANGDAAMAILATHLSAATASLVWMFIEWKRFGKPSMVGLVTGTIAGLATVTPASGFVGPLGGVLLGLAGGIICYVAVDIVKFRLRIDDSLDVMAVHGVGGITGTLLTGFLALDLFGGVGLEGDAMSQFVVQFIGVAAVVAWSAAATFGLVKLTQMITGLRTDEEAELQGLDLTEHGETGYRL
ncbi:ammonium transporter [Tepidamorphus sp. 3E244]|uniref:ammonium transporter n=1 Tax=Tepidamorphus sp. 3E244 TaxID=3385498 RepID=UPI0038FC17AB